MNSFICLLKQQVIETLVASFRAINNAKVLTKVNFLPKTGHIAITIHSSLLSALWSLKIYQRGLAAVENTAHIYVWMGKVLKDSRLRSFSQGLCYTYGNQRNQKQYFSLH